jgi:hypothetical protein
MSGEIIVAFIALGGVIISVLASLYTSMKQTNAEISKLRTEIQQTYTHKLLEKRIEVYPSLYKLLSVFTKSIVAEQTTSLSQLQELLEEMSVWDVNNAVFLSGKAFELSYRFRARVSHLRSMPANDWDTKELLSDLRRKADDIKLALKEDLGIFVVEFPDEQKTFESFREIAETVVKNSVD